MDHDEEELVREMRHGSTEERRALLIVLALEVLIWVIGFYSTSPWPSRLPGSGHNAHWWGPIVTMIASISIGGAAFWLLWPKRG